jgi:phosphoglycolate phosphatase-like HAD superfamily hydrolase
VRGAQDAGITGVLVKTGMFRDSDLEGDDGQPDHVIDGIGDLPGVLDQLAAGWSKWDKGFGLRATD